MEVRELLRDSMKVRPQSKRGARQKTSTPTGVTRMNYNENAYGMSPKVREAILKTAPDNYMYQDFCAVEIRKQLAAMYDIDPDGILMGAGSSNIIEILGSVFLNYGDEVVYGTPSYEAFPDMISENGAVRVPVPLTADFKLDLDGMLAKVNEKTKMVIVVNPNNPTGTMVSSEDVEAFLKKLPPHVIAIVDEAYIEYVTTPGHYSMIKLLREGYDKPLIILRTFSKIYGLAGLRIGYAMTDPCMIDALMNAGDAFNVSRIATAAAQAALTDQDFVKKVRDLNAKNRIYVTKELQKLGCDVTESVTNFIYFRTGSDAKDIQKRLEKDYRILIGAPDAEHNRVSIGTAEQNEAFLAAMKEILESASASDRVA